MDIKALFTDDDAVSPVIGVILMVAITVILAAVIASFVLGLGNEATNTNPQASFSFDYEQTNDGASQGMVTIKHDGGDTIAHEELYVRGEGFVDPGSNNYDGLSPGSRDDVIIGSSSFNWPAAAGSGDDSAVVSGDRVYVGADSDYEFDVVYEAQEGQSSSTLASDDGPDA